MAATFTFNGVDYTSLFVVSKITLPMLYQANEFVTIGKADGAMLQYSRYDKNAITIEGTIIDQNSGVSVWETRKRFMRTLSTKTPAQLLFSSIPNVYWNAIFDGSQDYDATDPRISTDISLTFAVPDGRAWATEISKFSSSDGSPIAVTYNGTAPSNPVLTQTMTGDNGLVGWVNSNGAVLQFGDPEEVDAVAGIKSDRAIRWGFDTAPAGALLNQSIVTPYPNRINDSKYPNKSDGSYKYGNQIATPVWADNADNVWHGPAIHGEISKNYNGVQTGDFEFAQRLNFHSDSKRMGRMEMTLESAGKSAFTAVLRDSSNHSSQRSFECWYNGKLIQTYSLPGNMGNYFLDVDINRHGNTVSYRIAEIATLKDGKVTHIWNNWSKALEFDDASTIPVDGLTLWCERVANQPANDMSWSDTRFTWINEATLTNVPNQFEAGDVVAIDVGARKVYVNGVETALYTIGNQWKEFAITENCTLEPVTSSWATPATATVEVREAYL